MFRQRSGILPSVNNKDNNRGGGAGGKWNFSGLNDGSDDDDDDFNAPRPVKAIAAKTAEEKKQIEAKLLAINKRVAQLEDEDDDGEIEQVKSKFNYGNQKQQYNHNEDSEEMSVASENLSVGPENSEEESFSMGH